jgi:hypothetical protein
VQIITIQQHMIAFNAARIIDGAYTSGVPMRTPCCEAHHWVYPFQVEACTQAPSLVAWVLQRFWLAAFLDEEAGTQDIAVEKAAFRIAKRFQSLLDQDALHFFRDLKKRHSYYVPSGTKSFDKPERLIPDSCRHSEDCHTSVAKSSWALGRAAGCFCNGWEQFSGWPPGDSAGIARHGAASAACIPLRGHVNTCLLDGAWETWGEARLSVFICCSGNKEGMRVCSKCLCVGQVGTLQLQKKLPVSKHYLIKQKRNPCLKRTPM